MSDVAFSEQFYLRLGVKGGEEGGLELTIIFWEVEVAIFYNSHMFGI